MESRSPTPVEVRAARAQAGLTQTEAGALVHTTCRTWQQWEAEPGTKNHRTMHPAFWELFRRKALETAGLQERDTMSITTKAQRQTAHDQALASTRISGHQPNADFIADCAAVVDGAMTRSQARSASLVRARGRDAAVATSTSPRLVGPAEQASYAAAIEQAAAIFALEDMAPSPQDKAIDAAVLAGRVAPEQARDELLAYIAEHKTVRGFIESRPWALR